MSEVQMMPCESTQRAMACEDVLREIFSHLTPALDDSPVYTDPEERKEQRSALLGCATANRAMSTCALRALWRVLDSLIPLLKLLRVVPTKKTSTGSDTVCLEGIHDASAWCRFQSYAGLVRELKHDSSSWDFVSMKPTPWLTLIHKLNGTPLLPHLQRLKVIVMPDDPSAGLLVLSSSIRDLKMQGHYLPIPTIEATDLVNHLFAALCRPSPSPSAIPNATPVLCHHLQSVASLTQLRNIDLMSCGAVLQYALMCMLSSLENLQALGAWVAFRDMAPEVPSRDGFRALECFRVKGMAGPVEKAIHMVASSSLRKLEVFLDTEMDAGDFKAFLGKVRRMVPSELSSLELFPNEFTPTSPKLSLADILKPMLSLRHIHELTCQFRTYPKDPSADDIAAFVAAWPELRFLWIIYDQDVPRDRQPIPFSTVVNLSQRCPNLEQLVLTSVDVSQAQIPSPLSSIPRMKQSRVRLVQLRDVIGESKADLLALALATDRLFPNLSIPSHIRCRPYRGEKDLWQRVIDSVACIQAARRICD